MRIQEQSSASHYSNSPRDQGPRFSIYANTAEPNIYKLPIDKLRDAIQRNQVSFPSQVPTFPRHDRPDMQRKLAQLYFVLDWDIQIIGCRYRLSPARVQQILRVWKKRAMELGYIQAVPSTEGTLHTMECSRIHIVLSASVSDAPAPIAQQLVPLLPSSRRLINKQFSGRAEPQTSRRPRRKFEASQIVSALNKLQNGRSVTEIADEMGASATTIRTWKQRLDMHLTSPGNPKLTAMPDAAKRC